MLTAFANQDGTLRRITEPLANAQWIDLVQPTADETALVVLETGLAVPGESDIAEIESSSRLHTRDGTVYLSLPLFANLDTEPKTVPVGFVLSKDRLITVRFAPAPLFNRFIDQNHAGIHSAAHVLVALMEAIVDRQADVLEHVKAQMESLSHRIFSKEMITASGRKREDAMLRSTLVMIGRVGELVSHVRESQLTAGRIVPFVETATQEWLPRDLKPRLHTLSRDIASLNDFDTHLNDKMQFLLDATLGFINIAQNNVMKVLTVVSVVGIPPVLIAGIYGMNFKEMPELNWVWGYAWGLAVIVVSGIIPLIIFRKRNWI